MKKLQSLIKQYLQQDTHYKISLSEFPFILECFTYILINKTSCEAFADKIVCLNDRPSAYTINYYVLTALLYSVWLCLKAVLCKVNGTHTRVIPNESLQLIFLNTADRALSRDRSKKFTPRMLLHGYGLFFRDVNYCSIPHKARSNMLKFT